MEEERKKEVDEYMKEKSFCIPPTDLRQAAAELAGEDAPPSRQPDDSHVRITYFGFSDPRTSVRKESFLKSDYRCRPISVKTITITQRNEAKTKNI
ncbi:hypothetical protein CEXT_703701 [Caerostris extrusa]|uniref:Uncharacterized protein n=1 Tax=Caerostris extrusa TaxID=172846 RepID=A0AAV4N716_CAEEX|nr:hypothetical protein CEXT_703701 [Caerostris extrusa]